MRELWKSLKRGTPMTRKFFWRGIEILGAVSLLVGIITAPFLVPNIANPLYRSIVWGFFIPIVIIIALSIGLWPYFGMRAMKADVENELSKLKNRLEEFAPLLKIQNDEKRQLLDHPYRYVAMLVKKITLCHSAKENTSYLNVQLYIVNGSMFELGYGLRFGETEFTINLISFGNGRLTITPTVSQKGADKLGIGSLSETTIQQTLGGNLADTLYSQDKKSSYSIWKFHIFLTLEFDGQTKEWEYSPQWDGVLDRKNEV